ncbi:hypothetical protein CsSME_00053497 [Camellia sinensis var. sinensis]
MKNSSDSQRIKSRRLMKNETDFLARGSAFCCFCSLLQSFVYNRVQCFAFSDKPILFFPLRRWDDDG